MIDINNIEYRAWDLKNKCMVYNSSNWYDKETLGKTLIEEEIIIPIIDAKEIRNSKYKILSYIHDDCGTYKRVSIEEFQGRVMAYTGYKTINYKKVYVGDYIESGDVRYTVYFDKDKRDFCLCDGYGVFKHEGLNNVVIERIAGHKYETL